MAESLVGLFLKPEVIKNIILGIIGLIVIVLFFILFGSWFIPLMLIGGVMIFLYKTEMWKQMQWWNLIIIVIAVGGIGYFLQRLTVIRMASVEAPLTFESIGLIAVVVVVLMITSIVLSSQLKARKMIRKRRIR